jgi:hypothetical protein
MLLDDIDDDDEDHGIETVDAEFTPLSIPKVSGNLLGTDELDNILETIDLEDCDLEDFEVLING